MVADRTSMEALTTIGCVFAAQIRKAGTEVNAVRQISSVEKGAQTGSLTTRWIFAFFIRFVA